MQPRIINAWNKMYGSKFNPLFCKFVQINIKGDKIFDLFETGSPFNFNDFRNKKGSVTQTILAKIDVIIHNQNQNEVNLFVRRSFSQHLFSWMNDSASRL